MKRLEYWKDVTVDGKPWATFHLVPLTTITEESYGGLFEDVVEIVKKAGFKWRIIETTEQIVSNN